MPLRNACPTVRQLEQWAAGRSSTTEAERLAAHVHDCAGCADRMEAVPATGPLSDLIRGLTHADVPAADETSSVQSLIDQLCQLPEADGDAGAGTPEEVLDPPDGPDEIGRFGPYRVTEQIGRGGMGVVFRAVDTQLARPVALKLLRPDLGLNPAVRRRFLSEARTAAALRHDHVAVIYQVGEVRHAGGALLPYIAMEFLEGANLADWLRRHPRPPLAQALRFAREIAAGLAAAHAQGIVHRDIKPGNVWVEAVATPDHAPGLRIRLLDFGLACTITSPDRATRAGTPGYMAPEQARGEPVGFRADLYSLGCILTALLGGKVPPAGPGRPRLTHAGDARVPPRLQRLIDRLLAPRPADRPSSARAVEQELIAIETRLARRARARYAAAAGLVLAVAGAVALAARPWEEPERPGDPPGGRHAAEVVQPPAAPHRPPPGPVGEPWLTHVAGLAADEQVRAVLAKLTELNPGFSGKSGFWSVEGGVVTELRFHTDDVRDISPVRALTTLRTIGCTGSVRQRGKLTDLSPLTGLTKLQAVLCWDNPIADLSPLRGKKLREFQAEGTRITSLEVLRGMPVSTLTVQHTRVSDLSPVRGMPLWGCFCQGCPVTDLSPLAATPVQVLRCDFVPERDAAVLKSIKTLVTVNHRPVADFWRLTESGQTPKP